MGFVVGELGDKIEARGYYERACGEIQGEGRAEAYYNLGMLEYNEGEYDKALSHFTSSLTLSPTLTRPLIMKSLTLSHLNHTSQAISLLQPLNSNS